MRNDIDKILKGLLRKEISELKRLTNYIHYLRSKSVGEWRV